MSVQERYDHDTLILNTFTTKLQRKGLPSGMLGFSRANLLCSTSIEQVPPVTTPAQPFCILSPNVFALQVSSECAPGSLLPAALGRFHCRHIALRALPCGCRIPAPVASHSCGSRELPAAAGVGGSALSTACGCRGRWQGLGRHRAEGRSAWSTGHAVRAASTAPLMLSELLNQSKGISLLGCILQKREGRTRDWVQRCPRGLRAACPPRVLAQAVRAVPRCSQQRWGRIGEGHD